MAAAAARISANEAFYLAAKENIQMHGGMGFTWEFDCHLYYRRAKLLALVLGSAAALEGSAGDPASRRRTPPVRRATMDFDDTPEEAAFRAEARAWLDENAKRARAPSAGMVYRAGNEDPELPQRAKAWQAKKADGRLRRHHLAEGLGRARRHADPAGDLQPGGGEVRRAARPVRHRPGHVHARR